MVRRSQHTDGEILFLLAEADNGIPIETICHTAGVSLRTFYRWRRQFGGLQDRAVLRLRTLEEENRTLRRRLQQLAPEGAPAAPAKTEPPRLRFDCGATRIDGPQAAADKLRPAGHALGGAIVGRYASLRTGR